MSDHPSSRPSAQSDPSAQSPAASSRGETFACLCCGLTVTELGPDGDRRSHCPGCLSARHVLDPVGGGRSSCGARMAPLSIAVPHTGDWALIHRCTHCHELLSHPVRSDDNPLILMRLAVRPLAEPPFPLEAFNDL